MYTPKLWCFEVLLFFRDFVKVQADTFVGGEKEEVADSKEEITIEYLDEVFEVNMK